MARKRSNETVAVPWYVRIGVYGLLGLVGVVSVTFGFADTSQVDSWFSQADGIALVVVSILAGLNINKDKKEDPEPPKPAGPSANQLLNNLRNAVASNRT